MVPPFRVSVMLDRPFATSETRMFSMEAAVSAQFIKALENAVAIRVPVVLNIDAGNAVRLTQFSQAYEKSVAAAKLIDGNEVRLVQVAHEP